MALLRSVCSKLAAIRVEPVKSTEFRFANLNFESIRLVFLKFACVKFAFSKFAPLYKRSSGS